MPLASLYRKYLRQVRGLPHYYLRYFFQIKASDDFRAIAKTPLHKKHLWESKIKRVSRDLRRIEQALEGRLDKFNYVLDLAYGRRGKLKWELMEPFLAQPRTHLPDPMIPGVHDSYSPVYSPELTALLTHGIARAIGKPIDTLPPTLSLRANPRSEEARLLGPLSKRLEHNTRWRYFTREWKKVHPPLEVSVRQKDGLLSRHAADVEVTGAKAGGFQNMGIFRDIEKIVIPGPTSVTRRERLFARVKPSSTTDRCHRSPWLRRRYQALLGRIPVLTYNSPHKNFNVSLHPSSLSVLARMSAHRRPVVDPVNLVWFEYGYNS
ncbi:hypothetical protein D9757_005436 [Collybiopsis confluens]|uniref:LYR motif-containing protein Cup1-like N-terminal domain-containing protein n=1 Tax=Collybiopsis confluens TaxID=2823264 RepID=A0A8H5HLG5_9AGAR|nr:hypothetical protein D9757_005436 [Collybiopsis confluens]